MDLDIQSLKEKLEPRINASMTKNNLPGMAIALVHGDKLVYARGFGARNIKKFLPYTSDTLNGFGSCTKSFTCLAIMQLQSQGKLSVKDPVSKYVPVNIGSDVNPITIHHLMSHSSGVPNLGSAELVFGQAYPIDLGFPPIPFTSWDDFYAHFDKANEEIFYKPSEHFHYFNGGYTILGEVIEKASGIKYEEYIKKFILDPLKMNRSGFLESHISKDGNISVPYEMLPDKNNKLKPTPAEFPFNQFIYAPGGLVSSVNEMANYVIMMMNGGEFEGNTIINTENIEKMYEYHYTGNVHSLLSAYEGRNGYGYGWAVQDNFFGNTLVQHGGGIIGGISLIGFVKELKLGFAAIGNAAGFPVHEVYAALALLMGKDPDRELPFFIRDNHYQKLCGNYSNYKDIVKVEIVNKLGILYVETKFPKASHPLIPNSDEHKTLEFYILTPTGVKMPIIFRIDEKRKVHFTFERNSFHKV
jgi:CubicO group peptidase (beta-lactamase class C family)